MTSSGGIHGTARISGPFRIDHISTRGCRIEVMVKARLGNYSGYVTLHSDESGAGIYCDDPAALILSAEQFQARESETILAIAARFSRAMLEAGFGPMYDMNNEVCARSPDDVAAIQFYPRGHVGPYR